MAITPHFLFLGSFLLLIKYSSQFSCVKEDGKPVDWYVMYKIPKIAQTTNFLLRHGLAYAYITSDNIDGGWKLSDKSINDSRSLPGLLLTPLYGAVNPNTLHILYNDDPPSSGAALTFGHTKGVVMTDKREGFWLIHSVPNFPIEPFTKPKNSTAIIQNHYMYPSTGVKYGQSFLCISLKNTQSDVIGTQLMYNKPKIYSANAPDTFAKDFPYLTLAAKGKYIKTAPWNHKTILHSSAGTLFMSYAKSGNFGKELYADWLAPDLLSDLAVETWSNGAGEISTECKSKYKTFNVIDISLNITSGPLVKFKNSNDHSKWAVSIDKNLSYVCIGDINRMAAQLKRGGGTVCFNNPGIWKKYMTAVKDFEPCPRRV